MGWLIAGVVLVGAAVVYFGGGHTLRGFGRDVNRTGEKIETAPPPGGTVNTRGGSTGGSTY